MSEYYQKIAERMLAEAGVRSWIKTDSLQGQAYFADRRIKCCEPTSVNRLIILAHECGHIALDHQHRRLPQHRREYEAERYAIHAFSRHKVFISPNRRAKCQRYVERSIAYDIRERGATLIDEEAFSWADSWIREETALALRTGRISLVRLSVEIPQEIIDRGLFPESIVST